jgi:hypothetical protein
MARFDCHRLPLTLALFLALTPLAAPAQIGGSSSSTTTSGSTGGKPAAASVPTQKLVSEFTPIAGSSENATALVTGLRSGQPITLTDSTAATTGASAGTTGSVTFTSPTRPMGYGNIRIALSLARTQLASQGITNPTPEQLQGALMGTTRTGPGGTTTTQGILQMRASGMGWGQIANSMGVKLGTVMSGKTPVGASSATSGSSGGGSGVTTAAGASAGGKSSGLTSAAGAGGAGKHLGITNAAGSAGHAGGVSSGLGHGAAAAGGAVTAAGARAGGVGGGMGAGGGRGKP